MSNKLNEKSKTRRKLITRLILLILYGCILVYFYYLLYEFGANPLIITFLIIFILLISIGPFLRKGQKSLYSRMFSNKKKSSMGSSTKRRHAEYSEKKLEQPRIFKSINLDIKYRKPIINKCEQCGNIVPNFVKKCPFCNNQLTQ